MLRLPVVYDENGALKIKSDWELKREHSTIKRGFSLVEVVVFVGIVGLFFVVAAQIVNSVLRNMIFNQHKTIASHYARQLEDWLRSQKEIDFNALAAHGSTSGRSYCFNNTSLGRNWSPTSCGYTGLDPAIYQRQVTLSYPSGVSPPIRLNVQIRVSWQEFGNVFTVPLQTIFEIFEES